VCLANAAKINPVVEDGNKIPLPLVGEGRAREISSPSLTCEEGEFLFLSHGKNKKRPWSYSKVSISKENFEKFSY
jgi:hypothetical protein